MKKSLLKIFIFISALTFSIGAWGATLTAKVHVGEGRGSATVDIYNGYNSKKKTATATESSTPDPISYGMNIVEWAYSKYTASPADGYKFDAWYTNSACNAGKETDNPFTTSTSKNKTRTDEYWAKFIPVTVNSVASAGTLNFTDPGNNTTTAVFNVSNADATADFTYNVNGAGWEFVSWSFDKVNNRVTITVRYTCSATTSQGAHTAAVTLTSKADDGTSKTATVTANVDLTPTLTANPTSLAFGVYTLAKDTKKNKTVALTYNSNAITFEKTADATIAPFSAVLSNNNHTLTVYFEPTEVGSWEKDLVLTVKNNQTPKLSATQTIHITGSAQRNTASITKDIADLYYVDDSTLDLNACWTSTSNGAKTYSIVSFTPSSTINAGATAPALTNNRYLSLGQAGALIIRLQQPQTTTYNAVDVKDTIIISKRINTISITGFDDEPQHKIAIESYDNELVLTSNNTDYTNWPIQNEQITGDYTMASFGRQDGTQDKWVVYTDRTPGLVEWRLWQEETYKYKGAETTFSVNVVKNTNCSCNLLEMSWTDDLLHNPPTVSTVGSNNDGLIDFGDIGEYLYFSLRKNGVNGDDMNYSLFTDGAWGGNVHKWAESMTSYTPFVIDMSDKDHHTTKVQFYKGHTSEYWIGGDTDDPFINNISVTRKRWMKYLAKETDKSQIASLPYLPKQERVLGDAATSYTFYVDFSTCSEWVKVASLDDHVTFDNDMTKKVVSTDPTANNTRGYDGIAPVTIKYYSENVEKKDVKIIFYTEFDNDTLIVPVETVGYIFKGTTDTVWTKGENWNVGKVPSDKHDVIIEAPTTIATEEAVNSITITTGSVTILPTGGLTVGKGGITGANTTNLFLRAGKTDEVKGQTGYLRVDPATDLDMPAATIELYTKAYYDMNATDHNEEGKWQFIGYPLTDGANAKKVFPKSWLYNWDAETEEWKNNRKTLSLQPFEGYATSQLTYEEGMLLTFAGPLVQNVDKAINLAYNAGDEFTQNMVANSYSAPIDVTKFEDSDFDNMQAAVYIFNTGSRADIKNLSDAKSGDCNIAGQYLSIPIGSARAMKGAFETPTIIAPMQGFCVHATGENAQLRLDYEKLVWNGNYATNKNEPLHINARKQEAEQVNSLCVSLYGEGVADNLYMLESDQYDAAFENGYDAKKMNSGEANIFSVEGDDYLAVDATNSLIGTQIGVRTGDTTAYVLVFTHLSSERPLSLLDNETNETIDINEGTEYTFFAVPNSEITGRFSIVESANAPTVTTGIEEMNTGVKAQKFIKDGQLYILKNGVLYTATGVVVR